MSYAESIIDFGNNFNGWTDNCAYYYPLEDGDGSSNGTWIVKKEGYATYRRDSWGIIRKASFERVSHVSAMRMSDVLMRYFGFDAGAAKYLEECYPGYSGVISEFLQYDPYSWDSIQQTDDAGMIRIVSDWTGAKCETVSEALYACDKATEDQGGYIDVIGDAAFPGWIVITEG